MRRVYIEFDDIDHRDVVRAIAMREQVGTADSESNMDGKAIAEICRAWMDMLDEPEGSG